MALADALIVPPAVESRGGSPVEELSALPLAAARLGGDASLCQANHDWFKLVAASAEAGADWWASFDDDAAGLLRQALSKAEGDFDIVLTQGGDNGRFLRVRGRHDPVRANWLTIWTDESVSMRADMALGRALMAAHEAREEVENIFDAAAEAMLMVDCGTLRILRSNPAAAQLYG